MAKEWLHFIIPLYFVAYLVARREQRRYARRLRAAKSAMSFARQRDATYTSVETGMLEWINHALRHEWRAVIGSYVDQIATESLEETLRASETSTAGVTIGATVEELTFGVVPLGSQIFSAEEYNPAEDYLHFEFDLTWQTVSSLIVLRAGVKPSPYLPRMSVPVSVTDLSITGRLLVGFRLAEQVAGRGRRGHLRSTTPEIHVAIQTRGLRGERPSRGASGCPARSRRCSPPRTWSRRGTPTISSAYLDRLDGSIAAASGPGGALVVDVAGAQRLPATNKESRTSNPYCELTYGGVTRRTATRINTRLGCDVRVVFGSRPRGTYSGRAGEDKGDGGGFGSPVGVARGGGEDEAPVIRERVGDGRTLPLRVRSDGLVAAGRAAMHRRSVVRGRRASFAPRSLKRGKDEGGKA